ncbi:hypothetical protein BGZ61DRAFT_448319 [Ilyonectria robusta]|uniref:uncharacterized protein n=1 Tax=Ilyonectria robusta TaxID=1079257 RepID=UPI001E8D046E|nr:uncharacterized protein BGZ61DRAFT_448319 [Ilyonectria robusta]KAH8722270.1 hypothetical protein BGZ61DRAFT_448319 [Ilyonectria robusta]
MVNTEPPGSSIFHQMRKYWHPDVPLRVKGPRLVVLWGGPPSASWRRFYPLEGPLATPSSRWTTEQQTTTTRFHNRSRRPKVPSPFNPFGMAAWRHQQHGTPPHSICNANWPGPLPSCRRCNPLTKTTTITTTPLVLLPDLAPDPPRQATKASQNSTAKIPVCFAA